jgi:uncharacterized SAM-binding protein YcdF (DUF218 family)
MDARRPFPIRLLRRSPDRASRRVAEIRWRRRVEQTIEGLGEGALRFGIDALARPAARLLTIEPDVRQHPAVVVLSGGIRSTGHLNRTTVARVHYAVALFQRGLGEVLVMSGGPRRYGRPSSAPAMRALAMRLGVPAERILIEGRSSRTAENAREVARLLAANGVSSVLLVTSALHMRRAKLCFERHDLAVSAAPVPRIVGEPPERASLVAQVLHEAIGLAYYRALRWI